MICCVDFASCCCLANPARDCRRVAKSGETSCFGGSSAISRRSVVSYFVVGGIQEVDRGFEENGEVERSYLSVITDRLSLAHKVVT